MIATFIAAVTRLRPGPAPTEHELAAIGQLLLGLAKANDWTALRLPRATGSEELLHPLHVAPGEPALYLVSDAAGVASAPHEHQTWAVIAGLAGNELNILYQRDAATGAMQPLREVQVTALDVLCLPADAIHATRALGDQPTFHLHLYGRPLSELPPYASRCYQTS
jgi:predicted metal-dependent enzyme (double-stranded beta helix superfamily)